MFSRLIWCKKMVLCFQEISHVDSQKYKEGKSVLELWESFLDLLFLSKQSHFQVPTYKNKNKLGNFWFKKCILKFDPKMLILLYLCLFATGLRLWVLMIATTWFVKKFHNLWFNNHMIQMMLKLFPLLVLRFLFEMYILWPWVFFSFLFSIK